MGGLLGHLNMCAVYTQGVVGGSKAGVLSCKERVLTTMLAIVCRAVYPQPLARPSSVVLVKRCAGGAHLGDAVRQAS